MSSNIYLPTAIQEAANSTSGVSWATALNQSPHATALNVDGPIWVTRIAVTAGTFRAAFSCMWAAEGDVAKINTAQYWLNRTRAWRTRSNSGRINIGDPAEVDPSASWSQAAGTYAPSVTSSPNDSSPGSGDGWYPYAYQIFGDYNFDLGTSAGSGGPTDYNGVNDASYYTTQAVDHGDWTNSPSMPTFESTWTQTLTNEDSAGGCVTDLVAFLNTLNLTAVWGPSPPTIYGNYIKNIYYASDGDYNDPSYVNLSSIYTDFNTDITNLTTDRTSGHNYDYDGVYYPIPNLSGNVIAPGAFGPGVDVGTAQGIGPLSIIGDLTRCRVGFTSANSAPNESAAGGSATPICDRVQYRFGAPVRLTVFEQGYYMDGTNQKVFLRLITTIGMVGGQIYEIPQPSFSSGPFITRQGGTDYCVFSMDTFIIFNSSLPDYVTAFNTSTGGTNASIITAW